MTTREMIYQAANASYNQGLNQAKLHDLSGAIVSLSQALRYNKRHTDARNLLGLVYFEYGEPVLALREWVISKNFQPSDNRADFYLKEVQKAGALDRLDSAAKKFNLGLAYAKEGNLDLARIQLKRVISSNPRMIRARQLLALIHMETGHFAEAKKELEYASRIDAGNERTVAYLQEVRAKLEESEKKKKRRKNPDVIDITDGNDVVRMPRQTFVEALDNSKSGILNILIGTGLGVLVAVFLIVPTVRQKANDDTASALINANAQAQTSQSDIEDLNEQLEKLQKKLDKYEGKADVKSSYELLLQALTALNEGELKRASQRLSEVTKKLLSKEGKALYADIETQVAIKQMEVDYEEGIAAKKENDLETAIAKLKAVVKQDQLYNEGDALYNLAECYEKNGDYENAIKYYRIMAENFSNRYVGRKAGRKADYLESRLESQTEEQIEEPVEAPIEETAEEQAEDDAGEDPDE